MQIRFTPVERQRIVDLAHRTLIEEETDDTNEAKYYLKGRGLNDEAIAEYKIGYIPRRVPNGVTGHDWRGRVIMPLYNSYNELVVLTSRNFRATKKEHRPHFHEQFNKKRYLYGLNIAKEYIIKKNAVIIVEGQFDTHAMHVNGIPNTTGILGSSFTFDHLCLLRRYCQNFFFLFDNDKAGKENLIRVINLYDEKQLGAAAFNTNFYPVFFDENCKDPDELIKSQGISVLKESIRDAFENKQRNMNKVRLWQ